MTTATHTIETPKPLSRLLGATIATDSSVTPTIARIALGLVILPHGLQKLFGLFGGFGFDATMGYFTEGMGLPWIVALAVILIESVGSIMLIAGVGARAAAVGVGAVMTGAVLTTHLGNGFFMNWMGNQAGEGFEYHLLALALVAIVTVAGAGAYSVDRWLTDRSDRSRTS